MYPLFILSHFDKKKLKFLSVKFICLKYNLLGIDLAGYMIVHFIWKKLEKSQTKNIDNLNKIHIFGFWNIYPFLKNKMVEQLTIR